MKNIQKRKFYPKNKWKYVGNVNNIIMRSSWEMKFAAWCDRNPNIIKWSSEEAVVRYLYPVDGEIHRYFLDFKIVVKNKSGNLTTYLIEIKPKKQTLPPTKGKKKKSTVLYETETYIKNISKWKAAEEFAKKRGWKFKIITEEELGLNG